MKRSMLAFGLSLAFGLASLSTAMGAPKAPKAVAGVPAGMVEVAKCNDGKTYYAKTNEHRGACSGHGGVASWADGSVVKSKGKSTFVK